MKMCTICEIAKPADKFHKRKASKDGLSPKCKDCANAYKTARKDRNVELKRNWNIANADRVSEYNTKYYDENSERERERARVYREENPEKTKASALAWRRTHPKAVTAMRRRARIKSKKTNPMFRFVCNQRNRVSRALKAAGGFRKAKATRELLGCPDEATLRAHFQVSFYPHPETGEEMTWDNYGKWHGDHIRPLADFDLSDPIQQAIAFHYTNMQPLWAKDNHDKNKKLNWVKPGPQSSSM